MAGPSTKERTERLDGFVGDPRRDGAEALSLSVQCSRMEETMKMMDAAYKGYVADVHYEHVPSRRRQTVAADSGAGRGQAKNRRVESMKKGLKVQFLPCNAWWLARESIRELRHTNLLREFVILFSSLMLDVSNMSEEDKLFKFMLSCGGRV